MRLGILFDHQHAALAAALGALLPGVDITSHDAAPALRDPALRAAIQADLLACDHVITQDLPPSAGPLATFSIRRAARQCHLLPPLRFAGFHPDVISVALDGTKLGGLTGTLHSRVALLAYLTGQTQEEAAGLYNRLVFARLGYFAAFARERAALLRRFLAYRINLAPIFDSWAALGCFMHSPDAPRMGVMLDLARLVCTMTDLAPDEAALARATPATLRDPLALLPSHPLFPDIAAQLNLPPEGDFSPPQPADGTRHAYKPEIFLAASYDIFRRAPRAALRAAPGIQAGLAALGLPEIDAPRAAARAAAANAPPDAQAFLTWHGTMLQIDAGSTVVIQRPLRPEAPDATDLLTPHAIQLGADARPMALLGGLMFSAGRYPSTVAICRGGKYLSAEPGRMAVRFSHDQVGAWESFLALTRPELDALRALLRGGWTVQGTGERIPRAAVRLMAGMQLHIGPHRHDLRAARPSIVSAPGAPLRIAVGAPATDTSTGLILAADPADPAADICLDPPPEIALPPHVGSAEAFCAELDARLDLPTADEIIHPALTLTNAERAWTFTHHDTSDTPRIGRLRSRLTLWRAADKTVLLARGLEGIIVDGQGAWKDHEFLLAPRRLANGAAAALLRKPPAEIIENPVCVFYNPNLQNYYHWMVEALPALHILAPFLPAGTSLLLPPTLAEFNARDEIGFDHREVLTSLGFGNIPVTQATAPAVFARDAIWLHTYSLAEIPASLLRSFRDRALALHKPAAQEGRIYLKRRHNRRVANADAVEALLTTQGFVPVYPEDLTQAEQIALFASARFVIAPHGAGLANLLFCQPGTRVLEISPNTEFRPYFWMLAEKLGLVYGVLPCATSAGGFNGDMEVDPVRLRALSRVLRMTLVDEPTPRPAVVRELKRRAGK
jgi:hypothetical protein